jgi:hypothetical protein
MGDFSGKRSLAGKRFAVSRSSLDGFTGRGRIFADFCDAPADGFGGDGEFNFFPPPFVEFFFPKGKCMGDLWMIFPENVHGTPRRRGT